MHTVYILKCSDNTHFTGCTESMSDQLLNHNNGEIEYTKSRLPVEPVVAISFPDKDKAFNFEKYLQSEAGRTFAERHYY